jgi:hypothetical protein
MAMAVSGGLFSRSGQGTLPGFPEAIPEPVPLTFLGLPSIRRGKDF